MTVHKKTRCDSKLGKLPKELQMEIALWCEESKSPTCQGGYRYAQQMLAERGIQVVLSTVANFYIRHVMGDFFGYAQAAAREQEERMKKFDPASADRARAFGEYTFMQLALGIKDPEIFRMAAEVTDDRRLRELKERLEPEKLALAERRVRVYEQRLAAAKGAEFKPLLTPEARRAKFREIFGISE